MARISEYQSDRLASSLVGTPGENRAGQILGGAVTQAAARVEETAVSIATKRQRVADQVLAHRVELDAVLEAKSLASQHDTDYADFAGPEAERAAKTRPAYEALFQKHLESVDSQGARDLLSVRFAGMTSQFTEDEMNRGAQQKALSVGNNLDAMIKTRAGLALALGRDRNLTVDQRLDRMQAILNEGTNDLIKSMPAFSAQTTAEYQKVIPASLAKAMLSGLVSHNPEEVAKVLDAKMFDGVLSAEDRKTFSDGALKAIPVIKERIATEELLSELGGQMDLMNSIVSGDPDSLQKIEESQISDSAKQTARDTFFKNLDNGPVVDDWPTLIALGGMVNDLFDFDNKGKRKGVSHKTRALDFQRVFDFAQEAVKNRQMTPGTAKGIVDDLFGPYYEQMKQQSAPSRGSVPLGLMGLATNAMGVNTDIYMTPAPILAWKTITGSIDDFAVRNKLPIESRGRMYADVLGRLKTAQTDEQMREATRDILRRETERLSPGTRVLPAAPGAIQRPDRNQVRTGSTDKIPGAIKLTGKGEEPVRMSDPTTGEKFLVTFKNGVEVKREKIDG